MKKICVGTWKRIKKGKKKMSYGMFGVLVKHKEDASFAFYLFAYSERLWHLSHIVSHTLCW